MSAVYFLVPISVCLAMAAVTAFIFAVRKGQFGDVESQKWKILFDQDVVSNQTPSAAKIDTIETLQQNKKQ